MPDARPIAVDLFAGAGGMSLGLEQSGFDVACAVEYDPVHAAVHKRNFPHCAVIPRSVSDLTGEQIRQVSGIGNSPVALVAGGPPCQGFSTMGTKVLDDPRNRLVLDYMRIVRELDASCFIFENVRGLLSPRNRPVLDEFIALARDSGYGVAPFRLLNARRYGVPQDRVRIILLGHRLGSSVPFYPSEREVEITCGQAMGDIPDADLFEELLSSDSVTVTSGPRSEYGSEMAVEEDRHWHFGLRRSFDRSVLTSSARTVHTETVKQAFFDYRRGALHRPTRLFRLAEEGVSCTLRAGSDARRGAFTSPRPVHYAHARSITVREMARLHGFPDWFRFHVTKAHGARQVGNAVPPPLARALGSSMMKVLGLVPVTTDDHAGEMNDAFLSMTMTEACRHFGVPDPIGRRDR